MRVEGCGLAHLHHIVSLSLMPKDLKAQGPSRTCDESKEEEEGNRTKVDEARPRFNWGRTPVYYSEFI